MTRLRKKETRTTKNKETKSDFRGNAGKTDGKKKEFRTNGKNSGTKTDFRKKETSTNGKNSGAKTDFRKKETRTDDRKSDMKVDPRKKGPRTGLKNHESRSKEMRPDVIEKAKKSLPENFDELKKSLNRASNWRERLDAIDKLGAWKSKEAVELLKQRLTKDPVYRVQEAAYSQLFAWGEESVLPEKKTGELVKDTNKILLRIKKSLPEDHTFEEFKEKVKKMRMDLYDTYEGNKGKNFNKWLKETWTNLATGSRG